MHSRLEYYVIFVNCHKIYLVLGCSDNQNCETAYCDNNHMCNLPPTIASVTTITVKTSSCSGCSSGQVEEGLQLHLLGRYGVDCSTNGLDNVDRHDYGANNVAQFNATLLGGTDDHGLGGCNNVSHASDQHEQTLIAIFSLT